MKKIILIISLLATTSIFAIETDDYTEFNYQEELSSTIHKVLKNVKQLQLKNKQSFVSKKNETIRAIEEKQRVKFILKDYKKLDIYVREDYTIIDNNYVLKNPSGWRRILIKQTNIWE